ncbi:aldehyde dehydrogenase 1A1 [Leptinotarsa decemlineata]|uniref:aldehyde dehydrogenase 1A1 n=1 Tax=Leptinotarsa decemlineata TaxID=7539 RepID=UPI003D30900E
MDPGIIEVKYNKLFINNEFVDAVSNKTFKVINPSTEKIIAEIAEADKADVDKAVAAAKAAFLRGSEWRSMDASQRGKLINKLADLMDRNAKEIGGLESLNCGKIYSNAVREIYGAANVLRYYAGYCDKIHGNTIPADGNYFSLTRKEPIGVVGQIVPWNFPITLMIWKWGPALATGCTIVTKPAEQTPLTALAVAALVKEAGFPPGVINVIPGFGPIAGEALCLHNDVRKVAFTGSTKVGHRIMEYAAKSNLKKVSLELGGKSPFVIFNDADVNEAVELAHIAAYVNHGQTCCAGSRTFVQSGIYEEFLRKSIEKAKAKKVGDPFKPETEQGPQIDKPSFEKIMFMIEEGKRQGATLETGGNRIGNEGYFVEPTIFSSVTDDMTIAREEIFGPVQSILKFETLEEVIERANDTYYGLAAGIITKDINTALVFAQSVEAGSVWVNCFGSAPQTPFGGYKQSGIGRDLGEESIQDYLETKTISIKLPMKC